MLHLRVKPSLIVGGQHSIWASLLKTADEIFQAVQTAGDELGAAEGLQTALILCVVLLDQVIDAQRWVAVCHINTTTYRSHHVGKYVTWSKQGRLSSGSNKVRDETDNRIKKFMIQIRHCDKNPYIFHLENSWMYGDD